MGRKIGSIDGYAPPWAKITDILRELHDPPAGFMQRLNQKRFSMGGPPVPPDTAVVHTIASCNRKYRLKRCRAAIHGGRSPSLVPSVAAFKRAAGAPLLFTLHSSLTPVPRPRPWRRSLPCARGGGSSSQTGDGRVVTGSLFDVIFSGEDSAGYNPPVSKLTAPFTQGGLGKRCFKSYLSSLVPAARTIPSRPGRSISLPSSPFPFHSSLTPVLSPQNPPPKLYTSALFSVFLCSGPHVSLSFQGKI